MEIRQGSGDSAYNVQGLSEVASAIGSPFLVDFIEKPSIPFFGAPTVNELAEFAEISYVADHKEGPVLIGSVRTSAKPQPVPGDLRTRIVEHYMTLWMAQNVERAQQGLFDEPLLADLQASVIRVDGTETDGTSISLGSIEAFGFIDEGRMVTAVRDSRRILTRDLRRMVA